MGKGKRRGGKRDRRGEGEGKKEEGTRGEG